MQHRRQRAREIDVKMTDHVTRGQSGRLDQIHPSSRANQHTHTHTHAHAALLWSPCVIGQTIIFLPCDFYLLFSFLA